MAGASPLSGANNARTSPLKRCRGALHTLLAGLVAVGVAAIDMSAAHAQAKADAAKPTAAPEQPAAPVAAVTPPTGEPAAEPPAAIDEPTGGDDDDDDGDGDWEGLEDGEAARNASVPMVIPDMTKQPQPPGADWEPPPQHSWVWYSLTAGRINPLGASTQFETGYRLQLWQLPGQLYEQSHFAIKAKAQITPAFTKLGGKVEFQPLAILNLNASLSYVHSFGAFNFLQAFDRVDDEYDDETLDTLDEAEGDPRDSTAISGYQVSLGMLLQAKVWNIAVRNNTQGFMMNMNLPDDRVAFWDVTTDMMFPNGGWVVTNDTDLLYLTDFGLRFGARYTYTHAYYDEADKAAGAVNTPTHRVGPAIIYTFFDEPGPAAYDKPTIALLAQWWAKHRYRTGATSHAAFPYILLAFIQQGDFITSD